MAKQMITKLGTKEVSAMLCCATAIPTSPVQPRARKERGMTKKTKEKRSKESNQEGRCRASSFPFPLPNSLTSWFSSAHPRFSYDPSLSLKGSSFFNCLATSRIKEYVLSLGDSLIHPSRLFSFPGIFLYLGSVCGHCTERIFGLVFLFLEPKYCLRSSSSFRLLVPVVRSESKAKFGGHGCPLRSVQDDFSGC
jgi:hypothetical protein